MQRKTPNDRPRRVFDRILDTTVLGYAVASTISIAASQLFCVLGNLVWLGGHARGAPRRAVRLPLVWPMTAFLALSLLSTLWAVDRRAALLELRSEWVPFVFFLLCVNHVVDARRGRMLLVLVGAATVSAVYGLSQSVRYGADFRITGSLSHYMTFAGVIMLIELRLVAQLLFDRRGARDAWLAVSALVLFAALLMTQTRGAWLGLLAGLVLLAWFRDKRVLLALPVLALLVVLVAPQPVRARVLSYLDPRDITKIERFYLWQAGWNIFLDHPALGSGPGSVKTLYPDYRHPDDPSRRRYTHFHSNVVQLAAERGALGLAAWLWIWIAYFRRGSQGLGDLPPPSRAAALGGSAAVVAFLVAGLTEYTHGDSEVLYLTLFLMSDGVRR